MSYIKDTQAYKAYEEQLRKEKEVIRKLKQGIIDSAHYACHTDEFEAVKNFIKFIDNKEALEALVEYYYDWAQESAEEQK